MSSTRPPDENDQGLDRLLGQARWPEPTDDQLVRLRGQWHASSGRRRRRTYRLVAAAAVAASLIVAAGLLAGRGMRTAGERVVGGRNDDSPALAVKHDAAPREPAPVGQGSAGADSALVGAPTGADDERTASGSVKASNQREGFNPQDPTLYEQVLLAGHFPTRPAGARTKKPQQQRLTRQSPRRRPTTRLAARGHDPSAEPADKRQIRGLPALVALVRDAAAAAQDPQRCEPLLWAAIRENTGFARTSAAELLSRVATERSLGGLAELAAMPDTHAAGVRGLARLATATDIAYLASREPNVDLRRVLLAALAARGTEQSVGLYLRFVARPESRREALDALADVPRPPTELLLAYLRSMVGRERLAAAQALGRVSDPGLAQALSQSLAEPGSRQDAIIALLLNSSPQAAVVVNEARADPYLVASVRAAEFEITHLDIFFPQR